MAGFGSGYGGRYGGGDRRHEIVSGKSYGAPSQTTTTRAHSPDPGPNPPRGSRANRSDLKPWSFKDPEAKRKKRIYKYKVYTVEGKVKSSLKKGLRWIKSKCSEIVRGYQHINASDCATYYGQVAPVLMWRDLDYYFLTGELQGRKENSEIFFILFCP